MSNLIVIRTKYCCFNLKIISHGYELFHGSVVVSRGSFLYVTGYLKNYSQPERLIKPNYLCNL